MKPYYVKAADLLDSAPVEWDHMASEMTQTDLADAVGALEETAVQAMRLAAYLRERGGSGCGDCGHARGVKAQNKAGTAMRKMLGFTYPASANISF